MKYKSSVYKCLALVTQMGLNIMVPTFICLFIGIWVGKFVGAWAVIPFLFLGMAAGMRNCYLSAMSATKDTKKSEGSELSGDSLKKEKHEDGQYSEDN